MTRLSGITPSGHVQLGNYLGAVRRWAAEREPSDLFFVSDLHAMTTPHNPQRLRSLTREQFAVLLAAGIDPDSLFVQSDLAGELGALNWILECTCSYGEASRMVQFKERGAGKDGSRVGLLTYPVLMAADILLQGADEVPVGSDQDQHVELARTLARRFNAQYGQVFTVPRAVVPRTAARVRDLADPGRKMEKSNTQSPGVVFVLDEPDVVRRKFRRATTDGLDRVRFDPDEQPGVANLLEVLAACTGASPYTAAGSVSTYAELKDVVAEAVIEELRPLRERTLELLDDPAELERVRMHGAKRAADRARPRLQAAFRVTGLR
ncbi:tryptophan--tRNA ligase [Saccharopolyspora hordei]|uniref:Tryptophan--tRNA ligase n=1 Tax=Saccharopolyspora hordei TaxID=1838 RepID=A0A853AV87_9PSEU|nr:tryptophan--tRNA ligase [Saccharopolyspora hordei]NYI86552.1 tryptophanyl-tRNA synthetase [Saccharopolyspora hordei]